MTEKKKRVIAGVIAGVAAAGVALAGVAIRRKDKRRCDHCDKTFKTDNDKGQCPYCHRVYFT